MSNSEGYIPNFLERLLTITKKTQKEISKETGIAESTISKWRDKQIPRADAVILLSKTYGLSADFLLGLSDNPKNIDMPTLSDLLKVINAMVDNGDTTVTCDVVDMPVDSFPTEYDENGNVKREPKPTVTIQSTDQGIYLLLDTYNRIKPLSQRPDAGDRKIFDIVMAKLYEDEKEKPIAEDVRGFMRIPKE